MVDSSGSTYCCEVVKRLDLARFLQYHATTKILFDEMMVNVCLVTNQHVDLEIIFSTRSLKTTILKLTYRRGRGPMVVGFTTT